MSKLFYGHDEVELCEAPKFGHAKIKLIEGTLVNWISREGYRITEQVVPLEHLKIRG